MHPDAQPAPKTLVVGLGVTGLSCVRWLAAQGVELCVTDTRIDPPGIGELRAAFPAVPTFLGDFAPAAFASAERLVISPGVALNHPLIRAAHARGAEIVGDIELFARVAPAPIAAITGSNGKSTVTTLVGEMARHAGRRAPTGGNLGRPALDLLADRDPDMYVLELSSFQLETTSSLRARAAVVLNISADHMDRYDNLEAYVAAKARIYHNAAVQVVNADDPVARALADPQRDQIAFTLAEPDGDNYGLHYVDGETWLARGGELLVRATDLRLAGRHNLANALATLAVGEAMALPKDIMLEALCDFTGLPHRMQWVGEWHGVRWYNDSKGTNVGATVAALGGAPGPVVLIAGGDGKGADFKPLREAVRDKARAVIIIGRDGPTIAAAIGGVVPVVRAEDLEQAVRTARELARRGDCVLLSPACASFDMFRNYEERGRVFADAVQRWAP